MITQTNYRQAMREIGNQSGPIGAEIGLAEFALVIQRSISTPCLRDLIDELESIYEPLDADHE